MSGRAGRHVVEYAFEAFGVALFMLSACAFGALFEHPRSPMPSLVPSPGARRALMGLAMGCTALVNIYSPWGRRSGAHLNPSVSLTFLRLGMLAPADALFYVLFQFAGAASGVTAAGFLLGHWASDAPVRFALTSGGMRGDAVAFTAEAVISAVLMFVVLTVANHRSLARATGFFAAGLVTLWITFEAPLSGMSMNPARSFGSAFAAREWKGLWIYLTAPPLGMLAASEIWVRLRGAEAVLCAKLHHDSRFRCIFNCQYHVLRSE